MTQHKGHKFPIGNQLWKLRKAHGRLRKFKTPGALWSAAVKYFDWCEDNPLAEEVLVTNRGDYQHVYLAKPRAMTLQGLCLHIGISLRGYIDYRNRPEFIEVCYAIDAIMYEQKFTGAAANLFNPSIIARDLALQDQKEHTVRDSEPIRATILDKEQYKKIREEMLKEIDC